MLAVFKPWNPLIPQIEPYTHLEKTCEYLLENKKPL